MAGTIKLYRVIIQVSDIAGAVAFYSRVLEMSGARVSPGRHYFDCGGTILACFDPRADGDDFDTSTNPDHVYFAVDDLEATFEPAKGAGCAAIDQQIKKHPWGEWMLFAKDPFGNPIAFVD